MYFMPNTKFTVICFRILFNNLCGGYGLFVQIIRNHVISLKKDSVKERKRKGVKESDALYEK